MNLPPELTSPDNERIIADLAAINWMLKRVGGPFKFSPKEPVHYFLDFDIPPRLIDVKDETGNPAKEMSSYAKAHFWEYTPDGVNGALFDMYELSQRQP